MGGDTLLVFASVGRMEDNGTLFVSSRRPVVSAPSRTNGTPLVHARGRRHTPLVLVSSRFDNGTLPWCSHDKCRMLAPLRVVDSSPKRCFV